MPELPEVQTVCDVLRPQLVGKQIVAIDSLHSGILANQTTDEFVRKVCGRTVRAVERRGKYITMTLDDDAYMRWHLRMTGCLLITPLSMAREKHTHAILRLDNDKELRFADPRRFGRVWLFGKEEIDTVSGMHKLGPEPFDDMLDAAYLKEKWQNTRRAVKDCLLDQTIIAGIGNIYSDEILFRAGIHPEKKACRLSEEELLVLSRCIPETMAYFVEKNAISPEKYLETGGRDYQNTPYLQVYGRGGKACMICGNMLKKTTVAGRTSVYCAKCQRLDENTAMR